MSGISSVEGMFLKKLNKLYAASIAVFCPEDHKDSASILKDLSAEKLKDMAGTSLTGEQLTILNLRLGNIRKRL